MPATWRGQFTTLTEDVPNEIILDAFGVSQGRQFFWGPFDLAVGLILAKTQHPDYSWLKRKSANIRRQEANYAEIDISFEGIPPQTDELTYKCTGNTSSEPIETHPKFLTDIATVANGAKFTDGKFTGWEDSSTKAGIKSYLNGNLTYEETRIVGVLNDGNNALSELGNRDTPPSSPVKPVVGAGRNWLMTGGTAEPIGFGGKIAKTWRLSAKRGWDEDIYTT